MKSRGKKGIRREEAIKEVVAEGVEIKSMITFDDQGEMLVKSGQKISETGNQEMKGKK